MVKKKKWSWMVGGISLIAMVGAGLMLTSCSDDGVVSLIAEMEPTPDNKTVNFSSLTSLEQACRQGFREISKYYSSHLDAKSENGKSLWPNLYDYWPVSIDKLVWASFSAWQNYVFSNDVNNSAIGYWYLQSVYINILNLSYLQISKVALRFYLDSSESSVKLQSLPFPTTNTSYLTVLDNVSQTWNLKNQSVLQQAFHTFLVQHHQIQNLQTWISNLDASLFALKELFNTKVPTAYLTSNQSVPTTFWHYFSSYFFRIPRATLLQGYKNQVSIGLDRAYQFLAQTIALSQIAYRLDPWGKPVLS